MDSDARIEIRTVSDAASGNQTPELPPDVAHVWKRSLSASSSVVEAHLGILCGAERERSSRYRSQRARDEFILTRGTLRSLIASYLHKTPQELRFELTQYGKPFLADAPDFFFNVSHSDGLALLAFAHRRKIGVDVERIRPEPDARKLAERFFSIHERDALARLSGTELQEGFFRCWTRKEAYIKARGEGLSLPLKCFDVSIQSGEPRVRLSTRPDTNEASRWTVRDLALDPEYAAAVAVAVA